VAGQAPEETVEAPVAHQGWKSMTFLHWSYEPAALKALLPDELEVDTWDGAAWVSLTPFLMTDFRLTALPPLGPVSTFPETNVRTYVRGPDGRDGLWFFSLEADSLATVVGASTVYGVPYQWADMSVDDEGETVRYRSRRRAGNPVGHDITVRPGPPCEEVPELDHWLTGRWRAYTRVGDRLGVVPVHHPPWPLCEATVEALEESLLGAAGLPRPAEPPRVQFSPGVDPVRIGLIRPL
jgi:uncharacterized protein YqjF (DUF2071 family)